MKEQGEEYESVREVAARLTVNEIAYESAREVAARLTVNEIANAIERVSEKISPMRQVLGAYTVAWEVVQEKCES